MNTSERYLLAHVTPVGGVLDEIARQTHLHTIHPRMLSGPVTGTFLTFVARMCKAAHILELGTFTGYSAICLARGLAPGGRVDTIEINDELEGVIAKNMAAAGHPPVKSFIGDACDILPTLTETYDLIYIDADKRRYDTYYRLAKPLLKCGGFLLADNVLWDGKVWDAKAADAQTKGIRAFNDLVQADPDVENVLLPINDGMMLVRKLN